MQSVLIVDESIETRTALRTALEHSGRQVFEAAGPDEGLRLAHRHHPSVIVLDLESDDSTTGSLAHEFQTAGMAPTPMLLLGTIKRRAQGFPCGEFISKPYHYAPLVRKIEKLLAQAQQPSR